MIRILNAENVVIIGEGRSVIDGKNCYDEKGEEFNRGSHGSRIIGSQHMTAYEDAMIPVSLTLENIEFSFREGKGDTTFIYAANYKKIRIKNISLHVAEADHLIKSWDTNRRGEIELINVKSDIPTDRLVFYTDEAFCCRCDNENLTVKLAQGDHGRFAVAFNYTDERQEGTIWQGVEKLHVSVPSRDVLLVKMP